ncbi:MAG: protein translocase subunit SecF [bacterium]
MRLFGETHIDFVELRKVAIFISGAAIAAGLTSLIIKGGPKLGLDFTGGIEVHLKFTESLSISRIRSGLAKIGLGGVVIQQYGEKKDNLVLIRTGVEQVSQNIASQIITYREKHGKFTHLEELKNLPGIEAVGYENLADLLSAEPSQTEKVNINQIERAPLVSLIQRTIHKKTTTKIEQALREEFKGEKNTFEVRSVNLIGPKVSEELRRKAVLAIIFSLAGMLIYIGWRFDFKFAAGAVAALIHDVFISMGALSLGNFEFNLPVIAALLTIIGYSLNDTIVIYARIKENLRTYRKGKRISFKRILNLSINQSLSRTIVTSLTTFIVVLVLFLWGGAVIHGFTFALLVGVIVGTYSSSFVATPIVYSWQRGTLGKVETRREKVELKRVKAEKIPTGKEKIEVGKAEVGRTHKEKIKIGEKEPVKTVEIKKPKIKKHKAKRDKRRRHKKKRR